MAAQARWVALLPTHPVFDEECEAARSAGLPVFRFSFLDEARLESESETVERPCCAIHRGFLLSAERYDKATPSRLSKLICSVFSSRYAQLYENLAAVGVHMVTSPELYTRSVYYPEAFGALAHCSPRALWTAVANPATVSAACFEETIEQIQT